VTKGYSDSQVLAYIQGGVCLTSAEGCDWGPILRTGKGSGHFLGQLYQPAEDKGNLPITQNQAKLNGISIKGSLTEDERVYIRASNPFVKVI
jgi:hypothetical protein